MKYIKILWLLLAIGVSMQVFSQDISEKNLTHYKNYRIPQKSFKEYKLAPISLEFSNMGMTSMPTITSHEYIKSISCIDCQLDKISEVYFELYNHQSDRSNIMGVVVKNYVDETSLNSDISNMKLMDNTIYFIDKNKLILYFTNVEDDDIAQAQLKTMQTYFQNKKFKEISSDNLMPSEFEGIDFSDSTYFKNIIIKKADTRSIQYLYSNGEGYIIFYSDGTVTVCGDCHLCQENIEKSLHEKPFSIYEVYKDKIMLHAPDVDVQNPLILEIHDNSEMVEWYIIDGKPIKTYPTQCPQ